MNPEAPSPPLSGSADERQAARKNERQFPERWAEAMEGQLPSQVLIPLRRARDRRLSRATRRAALADARHALSVREADHLQWSGSVDDRMDRSGVEYVDPSDPVQAAAFLARIDRKALTKRQRIDVAIEVAKLAIAWIERELADGD